MPDWILHHVDYSSLLISLEMDLKQVLQGDLPVLPPAGASLSLIREEKQINLCLVYLIALTKSVQVLSLALKSFSFSRVPSVLGKSGTHWSFST